LRQALLRRLMTWSESDIRVLTEALEECLGREVGTRLPERSVAAPPFLSRQTIRNELESISERRNAALAEFEASMEQMRQMMPEPQEAEEEEEPSVAERARNELIFTTERFRRLGSEFGGGRLQIYDEIEDESAASHSGRMQHLMDAAVREREQREQREEREQHQQEMDGEEGEAEEEVSTESGDDTESASDAGSEDTEDEYYSQLNTTTNQVMAEYDWYYRRASEMHAPQSVSMSELRQTMEQLEDDMDHCRIDEGTYIQRASALRDAYLDAKRVHTRVVATRIVAGPMRASAHD